MGTAASAPLPQPVVQHPPPQQPVAPQPQPPPPKPMPAPPPPIEQRCIACLNYHHHDHPSVLLKGANFQIHSYPAEHARERFEGIMISGLPEWFGRLTFRSGAAYEGGFRAGEFNGYGQYVVEGQYEYLGGWNDGKKEGFGREVTVDQWGNREEYIGGWKDDHRHGDGWINGRDWVRYYLGSRLPGVIQ